MKRSRTIFVVLFAIIFPLFFQLAFTEEEKPIEKLRAVSIAHAKALKDQIDVLEQTAKAFNQKNSSALQLREALRKTRLLYKRNQFLLEYYYPQYIKGNINGAPLYHLNPYTSRAEVEEPKGLQRLDELIQTDDLYKEKGKVVELARKLKQDYKNIYLDFKNRPIKDTEVFTAARLEIIRIFTLGVTGFDTPGSLNGLEEARQSLKSLKVALEPYFDYVRKEGSDVQRVLSSSFNRVDTYLQENPDFDTFDRLYFLKEFINPLYAQILELQKTTYIEMPHEVSSLKSPIDYSVANIFDADFLNPYYYSKLNEEVDSKPLQELGKRLFYDKRLSKNQTFSCSSCHNPQLGFSDGVKTHQSFDGKSSLKRNSPTLWNASYSKRFFTDLRAFHFEDQIEHVIISHKEFNTSYKDLFAFLNNDPEYKKQFQTVFGAKEEVADKNSFSSALASYLITLKSFNSPFDKYVRGEKQHIEPKVRKGFNLFMGKAACGTCHFAPSFAGLVPPLFGESESEVLGVPRDKDEEPAVLDEDLGRSKNNLPKEQVWIYGHSFKTPTVRNAELTGPYFHNGAYTSLEDVVDFYNHGGGVGMGLDVPNQTLPPDSLNLKEEEKAALIAFMKSLTDTSALEIAY
jgi:cytochrome c peroxidase